MHAPLHIFFHGIERMTDFEAGNNLIYLDTLATPYYSVEPKGSIHPEKALLYLT
jgi:hypothetical protein